MSKQTAVEWLIEQWPILESQLPPWLIEQAKEQEREQIKASYKAGFNYRDSFSWECDAPWESKEDFESNEEEFDRYYNETYKGGEQNQ